jgi:hypothetical protein
MARVPRHDPIVEIQFVQDLAMNIAFLVAERKQQKKSERDKARKARKKLRIDIERVTVRLFTGVVRLTPDRLDKLLQLLEAAKHELSIPRRKTIALQSFTRTFLLERGLLKAEIILEVSAFVGLPCDERSAQRYIEQAKNA